ncbi:MAG: hypothetical protein AAF791_14475 [Bacteroidota bacterium]
MRPTICAVLALLAAVTAQAQPISAVTDDGRSVWLHEDGTWTFAGPDGEIIIETPAPPPEPERVGPPPPPPMPPVTVPGGDGVYTLRYDASRWNVAPDLIPGESEHSFQLPFGAGFAATIFEVTEFPLPTVRNIVLTNAEEGMGGQVEVISETPVKSNGAVGKRLEFRVVTAEGIDVTMINTMYSGAWGTLQVVTWTTTPLMDRYSRDLQRFQDGIRIVAKS